MNPFDKIVPEHAEILAHAIVCTRDRDLSRQRGAELVAMQLEFYARIHPAQYSIRTLCGYLDGCHMSHLEWRQLMGFAQNYLDDLEEQLEQTDDIPW